MPQRPGIMASGQWISRAEFESRQARLAEQALDALGLDAVVVVSRGGGDTDMSMDVLWLTNHYSAYGAYPDTPYMGTARAHGLFIMAKGRPSVLISDVSWYRTDLVVADEVEWSMDISDATVKVLRRLGLDHSRIGLVGTSNMTASLYRHMMTEMSAATWTIHDQLVEQLRLVKSPAEQALMRETIRIGSETVDAVMGAAVEGATEADATLAGFGVMVPAGALLYDQPTASGPLAHHYSWSRIPSWDASRRMQCGEWFHIDHFGTYEGYLWDLGRSRVVGDKMTAEQSELLEVGIELVDALAKAIHPGVAAGEVHAAGVDFLRGTPFELKDGGFTHPFGHGIGMSWEPPWICHGNDEPMLEGMFVAIEGFLGDRNLGGAMFEENGFIGANGYENVSTARRRYLG
jgi:Xaa-Pro aminopeptidase